MIRPDSPLVGALHPSPNFEPRRQGMRPDILLLHYTGMESCAAAIDWLARPESKVSCHYVVDTDGTITQMVAEEMRAWHAGAGAWGETTDVNSASIGIEIHNPGHDHGYPDFPDAQMAAVTALSLEIVTRWRIPKPRVLAHSDTAPSRKIDPGEKFDWAALARAGVGLWVEPVPPDATAATAARPVRRTIAAAQRLLASYGYAIDETGEMDRHTAIVVRAFQRHFRPAQVDGHLDASTVKTLRRLVRLAGSTV